MEFHKNFLGYRLYKCISDGRKYDVRKIIFACTDTNNHYIFLYNEYFELPEESQIFILLHEIAHIKSIEDEDMGDAFAAAHMVNGNYWLLKTREITNGMRNQIKEKINGV